MRSDISNKGLDTPVQFVKGVGPRIGAILLHRNIRTVRDLLYFFPRAYEDRTQIVAMNALSEGLKVSVRIRIQSVRKVPIRGRGRSLLDVRCNDDTGTLALKWFHSPKGMEANFVPGREGVATGTVKFYMGRPEMLHPEINWNPDLTDSADGGRIVPIYSEIDGVSTRVLRKILWNAIEKYQNELEEELPDIYLKKWNLPDLKTAVREIHFPTDVVGLTAFRSPMQLRLIYEEFFKFEYLVLRRRMFLEKEHSIRFVSSSSRQIIEKLKPGLPFELTDDQHKVLEELVDDLESGHPMNRLVQGDVGSGKTVVAFLIILSVLNQRGQVAFMAPTEILVEQHVRNFKKLFPGFANLVSSLTGRTTANERQESQDRLVRGESLVVIGTHALIEEPVQFSNLCLIVVDEQHRFGVEQRLKLRQKGERLEGETKLFPHLLLLTATPIPRTLALSVYGDLNVSSIRHLPAGRKPITTKWIPEGSLLRMYEQIHGELAQGRQVYFVYPLISESEAEGFESMKSAEQEYQKLKDFVFPEYKIGLLHGQLKPQDKEHVMSSFKNGEIQILVSTTVVEVGVDIPNASVIVVEHADRFGLSQLHQLRGRVGRGTHDSYCFLVTKSRLSETTVTRLKTLEKTQDGFEIAEVDLEIRGPGEFLGTRQAGILPFRMANLVRDSEWMYRAREDVLALIKKDPDLLEPGNQSFRQYHDEGRGRQQREHLKTY